MTISMVVVSTQGTGWVIQVDNTAIYVARFISVMYIGAWWPACRCEM